MPWTRNMTDIEIDLGYCRVNHRQTSHNLQVHSCILLNSRDWQSDQSASWAWMASDHEHSNSKDVKRPGILRLDCRIVLPDDQADVDEAVNDETIEIFKTSITHAELWSQLQWQLHSIKQHHHLTISHAFELTFSNIDEKKKKSTHRIHKDVPFYNVPAPIDTSSIDIVAISIDFKVKLENNIQAFEKSSTFINPDTTNVHLSDFSPMLIGNDELRCFESDLETDDLLSIGSSNECVAARVIENTTSDLFCKSLELNETLAAMVEAGLRSVLSITPGRMPKHVSVDSETMARTLSQIAPSAFLPNYASNMAGRMAFVSRIATVFLKLDTDSSVHERQMSQSQHQAQTLNAIGDGVIQRNGQARWECILWNSAHADLLRQSAHKPLRASKKQKNESQVDLNLLEPASDEEMYLSEQMLDSEFGDDCSISCLFDEDLIEDSGIV